MAEMARREVEREDFLDDEDTGSSSREIEGRDSVGLYLEEISRNALLTAEEEVELAKTIEAGLMAEALLNEERIDERNGGAPLSANREELEWLAEEGRKAKDRFLTANLRLVVSIARRYSRSSMPMLDIIQEGNTGLIRAVEKFDYTKGWKFSTYATWWIRQSITRGMAQQSRIVRLPVHIMEELNKVNRANRTLERDLGREPEPEEIAQELGIDTERVIDLISWGRDHTSLDMPVGDDGEMTLGGMIGDEVVQAVDDQVINSAIHEQIEALVGQLDEREADIIRRRFGLRDGRAHKLADIGASHGISAERVRQLERQALRVLRNIENGTLSGEENSGAPSHHRVPRPGKRATERLELRQKLKMAAPNMHEEDVDIISAYIEASSLTAAAERVGMKKNTFTRKYKLAKAALSLEGLG